MENASKALIFAASVLISIVIISMLVLVYNSLTSYQQTSTQTQREAQIYEFNKQFEGYNRANVRGNELYSLISKVIDYNQAQSDIGENNENFEPMTVSFTLDGKNIELTKDNVNRIFKTADEVNGKYTFDTSKHSDTLREKTMDVIDVLKINPIHDINGAEYFFTDSSLERLVTAYDKIFIDKNDWNNYLDDLKKVLVNKNYKILNDQSQIFYNFNSAFGMDFFEIPDTSGLFKLSDYKRMWNVLNSDEIKGAVNTYYEYVQFKRGIFECIPNSVAYSNTGRIIKMEFRFTGKFD